MVLPYRSLRSTYGRWGSMPLYAGRMIFELLACSSMMWALQPTTRAMAKSGVNSSSGRPSIW